MQFLCSGLASLPQFCYKSAPSTIKRFSFLYCLLAEYGFYWFSRYVGIKDLTLRRFDNFDLLLSSKLQISRVLATRPISFCSGTVCDVTAALRMFIDAILPLNSGLRRPQRQSTVRSGGGAATGSSYHSTRRVSTRRILNNDVGCF